MSSFSLKLIKGRVTGWSSQRGGPWRPKGGQGLRPCSREGARRGWRTHDCSIIEMTRKTKALYRCTWRL